MVLWYKFTMFLQTGSVCYTVSISWDVTWNLHLFFSNNKKI